jgi:hypothetical protein
LRTYEINLSLPLSDDHLKAIGRVAANWTMIEHTLERYIWFMVSMGYEVGMCLTTHMSFPQRLQAVLTLSHDMFGSITRPQFEALKKFAGGQLNEVYGKRNNIVHAVWQADEETGEPIIAKRTARIELKETPLPYTPPQVEAIAKEIEDVFVELNQLLLDLEPPDQTGQKPPSWLDQRHWQLIRRKAKVAKKQT